MLYDEPTSAQDPANEHAIFALLAQEAKSRIIILVSHSEAAAAYARHVIRLA